MNMHEALKKIWPGIILKITTPRGRAGKQSETGRLAILDALKEGPKDSTEIMEITGIPQTTFYQYIKTLAGLGLIHSGKGIGKFYGLIGDILPCKIDPMRAYLQRIYDYLAIPRKLKEIYTEFSDKTQDAVGHCLRVLRGRYGAKARISLSSHYYSQIEVAA